VHLVFEAQSIIASRGGEMLRCKPVPLDAGCSMHENERSECLSATARRVGPEHFGRKRKPICEGFCRAPRHRDFLQPGDDQPSVTKAGILG